MTFFSKGRMFGFFRRPNVTPGGALLVKDSGPIDQAFNDLLKAIVKNSRGLSRARILAAVESLRSAVKTPPESA